MHIRKQHRPAWDTTHNKVPRPIADHGLLGQVWVKQHMMLDPNWSLEHIENEYKSLSKALKNYFVWMKAAGKYKRKNLAKQARKYRIDCRNGFSILNKVKMPQQHGISQLLQNHKDMIRLYNDMPIEKVNENIDNRTFNMRKEYDRLKYKKSTLENRLKQLLAEKEGLNERLRYEDQFRLGEIDSIGTCKKKIQDTQLRLQAAQTIHTTYKKMIQVLQSDANFYEKILDSLVKDSEDQHGFILYILEVGRPAIRLFNKLKDMYKKRRERHTKKVRVMLQDILVNGKKLRKKITSEHNISKVHNTVDIKKHYERSSESMKELATSLEEIEEVMKQLKEATLTSNVRNIYSSIKTQTDVNRGYVHHLAWFKEGIKVTHMKQRNCIVYKDILRHNYMPPIPEIENDIRDLKKEIEIEDKIEEDIVAHMKETAKLFVLLRFTLWNIHDVTRHINIPQRRQTSYKYPNAHLKLPLLKFDMLMMTACAPPFFEENIEKLFDNIRAALKKIVKIFVKLRLNKQTIEKCSRVFAEQFLIFHDIDEDDEYMQSQLHESGSNHNRRDRGHGRGYEYEDDEDNVRLWADVPTRAKIKQRSSKIADNIRRLSIF